MKWLVPCLVFLSIASCIHKDSTKPSENRNPASEFREFREFRESHLSPEEVQELSKVIENRDEKRVEELLRTTSTTQALASSFDERLFALKTKSEAEQLMTSNLYCKVLNLRSIQERVDEKAIQIFEFTAPHAADRAWLLSRMEVYAQQNVLNETAIIQLLRTLRQHEEGICKSAGCIAHEVEGLKFRVAPFDDEAFAEFVQKHRKEIAKYGNPRAYDLKPGSCFGDSRMPSQASSYDWKNRNWVGSVLPDGNFAITYDDGPSGLYTRGIRDVWANARMAKPAFFWLTKEARKHPDIVKELHSQGYIIGSHSWGHPDIGNLARSNSITDLNVKNKAYFKSEIPDITNFQAFKKFQLDKEISGAAAELGNIIGERIRYFRLPYGSGVKNDIVASYFTKMNVEHFFWRVDSMDWQDKNPVSVRDRVVAQMKTVRKGIVLFHDIHPQSLKAAELLVQYFNNNPSFKAVSLDDIPGLER